MAPNFQSCISNQLVVKTFVFASHTRNVHPETFQKPRKNPLKCSHFGNLEKIQKTNAELRRAGKLKWIALRYRNGNNQKFLYVNDP